jgi:hypothetical protein
MDKKMGQKWLDRLDETLAQNSKLSLFLMLQMVITALLVIGYFKLGNNLQTKIELPKTIKEEGVVIVGKDFANETYFRMWGREDIEMISTFNQKSIKEKMQYLKERMYPPVYYKYEDLFKRHEKEISSNLVSQKFEFNREQVSATLFNDKEIAKGAEVLISGYYSKNIDEDEVIKAQECTYKLNYIMEGGHLYVESFKTTCE